MKLTRENIKLGIKITVDDINCNNQVCTIIPLAPKDQWYGMRSGRWFDNASEAIPGLLLRTIDDEDSPVWICRIRIDHTKTEWNIIIDADGSSKVFESKTQILSLPVLPLSTDQKSIIDQMIAHLTDISNESNY